MISRAAATAIRWGDAQAKHPPCVICGRPVRKSRDNEPLCRYIARATCGPVCRQEHHPAGGRPQGVAPLYRKGELVEVDYAGGFGRQTVRTRVLGRMPRL